MTTFEEYLNIGAIWWGYWASMIGLVVGPFWGLVVSNYMSKRGRSFPEYVVVVSVLAGGSMMLLLFITGLVVKHYYII